MVKDEKEKTKLIVALRICIRARDWSRDLQRDEKRVH